MRCGKVPKPSASYDKSLISKGIIKINTNKKRCTHVSTTFVSVIGKSPFTIGNNTVVPAQHKATIEILNPGSVLKFLLFGKNGMIYKEDSTLKHKVT